MSLRASLVDAFKAESTISAITGTRVFDMFYDFEDFLNSRANRVSKFPAITIESDGVENENNLELHDNLNNETFTITCYQQVNLSKLRSRSNAVQNKERDILRQVDTLGDAVNAFIKDKRGAIDTYYIRRSHITSDTDDVFETEDNREIITRVISYSVGWSIIEEGPETIPVNSAVPIISGTPGISELQTTTNGTWTQSPISFTYRWLRNDVEIAGETTNTYTTIGADDGTTLKSEVVATNGIGPSLPAESVGTAIQDIPVNTLAPLVSGLTVEGSTLTSTNGTWTNSPTSFTYRWLRAGSPISGATSITYVSQAADVGLAVTSEVTAINASGSSLPEVSSNNIVVTSAALLPIQLGVEAWLDFGDSSKLVEGATSVNVAGFNDSSGNGNDFGQLTPAAQFTYNLAGGYVEGDGTQFLEIASRFGLSANPDITIIAKVLDTDILASASTVAQIGGISVGNTGVLRTGLLDDDVSYFFNNGNSKHGTIAQDTDVVLAFRRSSGDTYGDSEVFINGVLSAEVSNTNPTNVPTNTDAECAIGGVESGGIINGWKGRVYQVMIFTSVLTDQNITDLTDFINGV